jgi:hypothetical protein
MSPPAAEPSFPSQAVANVALEAPARPSGRLGRGERSVLAALALAGLVLTLYRNDVLGGLARGIGAESAYSGLTSALGGPSRDTPQGVRAFTASLPALAPPEALKPKASPPRAAAPRPASEAPVTQGAAPRAATKAEAGKQKKKTKGTKAKPGKDK